MLLAALDSAGEVTLRAGAAVLAGGGALAATVGFLTVALDDEADIGGLVGTMDRRLAAAEESGAGFAVAAVVVGLAGAAFAGGCKKEITSDK